MLLAYQRQETGETQRKSVPGWRLFDVAKMETCSILEETFQGSRSDPHQHHYTWNVLYARVT
jgi:hypothetical protein